MDVGSKTISVRADVYRVLKAKKDEDETFSDVIERLLRSREQGHSAHGLVGLLEDDELEEVREKSDTFRDSADVQMDRYS
jgi:predicted CopG family antitoxin